MSDETCGTGTGEPYTRQQPRIADRCPTCGAQSLFIGSGGWLTCSVIGCKEPGVSRASKRLTRERDDERERAQHNMDMARDYTGELWSARCGRAELALAASQAEAAALREALVECNKRLELACGCDGEPTARIENLMYHAERAGSKPWRDTRAVLAARAALSRAPGSREALREVVERAVEYARDADVGGYDHTPEWIVARLVPDAGQKGAEG